MTSGVSLEHAVALSMQQPKGRRRGVKVVAYTNAAMLGNKWPELQFRTVDGDVVVFTETRLRLGEGDDNLMAHDYLFFFAEGANGRIGDETLLLFAGNY